MKARKTAPVPAADAGDSSDDLLPILEAMLFAAHESLSTRRLARALENVKEERVAAAIAELQRGYDEKRSPLMLTEIAGGWRLVTRPEFAPFLARLFSKAEKERLSPAALETLAIVAYRQPATRAEIEAVRGVMVAPLLKVLHERRLIKVTGRAEVVGRPLQYGTTRRFLDTFGLASLDDLPNVFPRRRDDPPAAPPAPSANGAAPGVAKSSVEGEVPSPVADAPSGVGDGHATNGALHVEEAAAA